MIDCVPLYPLAYITVNKNSPNLTLTYVIDAQDSTYCRLDLPTVVSGFTYCHLGFTYHHVWILNLITNPTWWSLSFFYFKKFIWWSFSDFIMVIIFWCWSFSVFPIQKLLLCFCLELLFYNWLLKKDNNCRIWFFCRSSFICTVLQIA